MNKNIDRSSILQMARGEFLLRVGPYEDIGLEPAEIVKRLKDAEKAAEGRNA